VYDGRCGNALADILLDRKLAAENFSRIAKLIQVQEIANNKISWYRQLDAQFTRLSCVAILHSRIKLQPGVACIEEFRKIWERSPSKSFRRPEIMKVIYSSRLWKR
jgi:hypothetical protein